MASSSDHISAGDVSMAEMTSTSTRLWSHSVSESDNAPRQSRRQRLRNYIRRRRGAKRRVVSFLQLFRYTTTSERFLLLVGVLLAVAVGATFPSFVIMIGGVLDHLAPMFEQLGFLLSPDLLDYLREYFGTITLAFLPFILTEVISCCLFNIIIADDKAEAIAESVKEAAPAALQAYANSTAAQAGRMRVARQLGGTGVVDMTPIDTLDDLVEGYSGILLGLGVVACIGGCLFKMIFNIVSRRVGERVRKAYFRALLANDAAWHASQGMGTYASKLTEDIESLELAVGENTGMMSMLIGATAAGVAVAFVYGWKLTLAVLVVAPIVALLQFFVGRLAANSASASAKAFSKAGSIAEETLALIRVVTAYNGQDREISRFQEAIAVPYKMGIKRSMIFGLGIGLSNAALLAMTVLCLWYGNELKTQGEMSGGDVFVVFAAIIVSIMAFGMTASCTKIFSTAQGAAYDIYEAIDHVPMIDNLSDGGLTPSAVKGEIEFRNVSFRYTGNGPIVLNSLSFTVAPGSSVAIVGHSGSGKSTTIQLLERFYDATEGALLLDGRDFSEVNIQWLRAQIGLVGQMPKLFAGTIAENIALGAGLEPNESYNPDGPSDTWNNRKFNFRRATQEEIVAAAKLADAHDFIMALPEGYETRIGEGSAQLSEKADATANGAGGQKQRIAIARALVRDPKILLLDEATSALDSQSEKQVQKALQTATKGRTTIIVAHRLQTIRSCDRIIVLDHGKVIEDGNHDTLLAQNGFYARLARLQGAGADDMPIDPEPLGADASITWKESTELEQMDDARRRSVAIMSQKSLPDVSDDEEVGFHSTDDEAEAIAEEEVGIFNKLVKKEPAIEWFITLKALRLNAREAPYLILGACGAIMAGCIWPIFSNCFAELVFVLLGASLTPEEDLAYWMNVLGILAAVAFVGHFLAQAAFGIANEALTHRLRLKCFSKMLQQDIGWYDLDDNALSVLMAKLSAETAAVKSTCGELLLVGIMMLTLIIGCIVISATSCIQLTIPVLIIVPVCIGLMALVVKFTAKYAERAMEDLSSAASIAGEAADNVWTVTALAAAPEFMDKYLEKIAAPKRRLKRAMILKSIVFGFTNLSILAIWGICLYFCVYVIENDMICSIMGTIKALCAMVFAGLGIIQFGALVPDTYVGQVSATRVLRLLRSTPAIEWDTDDGDMPPDSMGNVVFEDLTFSYPARKAVTVLKGLSISVAAGKTLALVGPSGCGKSTLIGLIERFYKPKGGCVYYDGKDISTLNTRWLRRQLGLVSQEPELFATTIRENLLYGCNGSQRAAISDDQLYEALRQANAYDFTSELQDGLDHYVGIRGGFLSGGQRQRIAIARALLRDPKVLLLDEATSALDPESEKHIQEALDRAAQQRTTITIAHRLSTIRNADIIAVVMGGVVVEQGSHSELLAKDGVYARMWRAQTGE